MERYSANYFVVDVTHSKYIKYMLEPYIHSPEVYQNGEVLCITRGHLLSSFVSAKMFHQKNDETHEYEERSILDTLLFFLEREENGIST